MKFFVYILNKLYKFSAQTNPVIDFFILNQLFNNCNTHNPSFIVYFVESDCGLFLSITLLPIQ
jgi:hypothetical protein